MSHLIRTRLAAVFAVPLVMAGSLVAMTPWLGPLRYGGMDVDGPAAAVTVEIRDGVQLQVEPGGSRRLDYVGKTYWADVRMSREAEGRIVLGCWKPTPISRCSLLATLSAPKGTIVTVRRGPGSAVLNEPSSRLIVVDAGG